MKKRILAAMLTMSMVMSMTACGNSEAGGPKDSAQKNGDNGNKPYTVTMVLQGSTQPDEERIEQKIDEILEPKLNANIDIVSSYSLCYQGMKKLMFFILRQQVQCSI